MNFNFNKYLYIKTIDFVKKHLHLSKNAIKNSNCMSRFKNNIQPVHHNAQFL